MELRCLGKCILKHLMVSRFLKESGREFQTDEPENARLVLIQVYAGSWWDKVVRTVPTRGPGEERTNVLGSLPIAYFKHHYSSIVFQLFR